MMGGFVSSGLLALSSVTILLTNQDRIPIQQLVHRLIEGFKLGTNSTIRIHKLSS